MCARYINYPTLCISIIANIINEILEAKVIRIYSYHSSLIYVK